MSELLLKPHSKNGLALFSALVAGQMTPQKRWCSQTWRAKFLFRSLLMPASSWRHMGNIANVEAMQQVLPVQPTLPGKLHRPYLHLGLSIGQRVTALRDHYQFVEQIPNNELRQAMLSASGLELMTISGKDGEEISASLLCCGQCDREGEVNLTLDVNGVRLALLTFAIVQENGRPLLVIGGLQGAHRETSHALIRQATKACHGLFPKRLLLEVLMRLAAELGIQRIYAVRDGGHVFYSLRYRLKKKDLFHASYDEFWQSVYATEISRHLYQLPLSIARKPLEEIASKKRAEYRRRYELLEQLHQRFRYAN